MPRRAVINLGVICAVASALLSAPATASASRHLSRNQATRIAEATVRRDAGGPVDRVAALCYTSFRRATARNLHRRWRRWDCLWSTLSTNADGSRTTCLGEFRLIGQRHGATYRVLSRSCGPATTTSPTPSPAPSPSPTPGLSARQQQMIDEAIRAGIQRAQEFIDHGARLTGSFYYGQMDPSECTFLNATRVRCPLYMWWEAIDQDANLNTYVTREILRPFVFVEDLGTALGFDVTVPTSELDVEALPPFYVLCSYRQGYPPCPAERTPIAYPPAGPPSPT